MKDFKKSIIYQIYPKSFKDSTGNGLGDLRGVIEKMDYLSLLGVDYIWLTPFYVSPQRDNGYDVADYLDIDPNYGTMKDFEDLVQEADNRGIGIMLDMVFNHTSVEHIWFKKAMEGNEEYKDYYIFRDSVEGKEPTNWISKFGGSAWEYVKKFDQYYLHLFDKTQADLNWENPKVRDEVNKVIQFWMEKGVKGFRLDVINLISKPEKLENDLQGDGRRLYTDGPKIHQYLKDLNKETFGKGENIVTVGEMSSTNIENCIKYSNPDEKELSMVFNFHHLKVDYKNGDKWASQEFDFPKLKEIFNEWQVEMEKGNGWSAVFWCNHDQPRIVSRFGNDKNYLLESAKMLATSIHFLRGTPYIYQGEEIGMTNPYFKDIEQYRDVESLNYFQILKEQGRSEEEVIKSLMEKSRDNSRTPMQWDSNKNSGFTTGTPWININDNYGEINVENSIKDRNSIFNYYKKLIKLRKEMDIIAYGSYEPVAKEHPKVFSYLRSFNNEKLLVLNNFYGELTKFYVPEEFNMEEYSAYVLISNYKNSHQLNKVIELRPYESIVFHLVKKVCKCYNT